jgi:hypothetical protein
MITEPTTGWAKNALQDFETLYIGGAEPASFAGPLSALMGPNQVYAIAKESLPTRMARTILGRV